MVIPVPFTIIYTDLLVYAFMKNKLIESDKILRQLFLLILNDQNNFTNIK